MELEELRTRIRDWKQRTQGSPRDSSVPTPADMLPMEVVDDEALIEEIEEPTVDPTEEAVEGYQVMESAEAPEPEAYAQPSEDGAVATTEPVVDDAVEYVEPAVDDVAVDPLQPVADEVVEYAPIVDEAAAYVEPVAEVPVQPDIQPVAEELAPQDLPATEVAFDTGLGDFDPPDGESTAEIAIPDSERVEKVEGGQD